MIKQFVSSSFCLKCEGCCRFSQLDSTWSPRLLNTEQKKLDQKIHLLPNSKEGNFICASFNLQDNKCKIYRLRPFECQLYPFLINRKEKKVFLAVDLKCPFIEENLSQPEFKEYAQYLTAFLNSPQGLDILKNNPQIIQVYEGVLNLAALKL